MVLFKHMPSWKFNKKDEYPVNFIKSITPIDDLNYTSTTHYTIKFGVKDKNKLIEMINTKRN
jgi:hypothetical protein